MVFKTFVTNLDKPNKNNRVYGIGCFEKYLGKKMPGVIGDYDNWFRDFTIEVSKVSHYFTLEHNKNCDSIEATIEIANTPYGQKLEELLQNNKVDFRHRGTGIVDDYGVITNFKLISVDAVIDGA